MKKLTDLETDDIAFENLCDTIEQAIASSLVKDGYAKDREEYAAEIKGVSFFAVEDLLERIYQIEEASK